MLIHGDSDDNQGTFPINSERLFNAIKGAGGTTRFVFLLYEAHSYRGKENLLHMLWEQDQWLEKYVKNNLSLPLSIKAPLYGVLFFVYFFRGIRYSWCQIFLSDTVNKL